MGRGCWSSLEFFLLVKTTAEENFICILKKIVKNQGKKNRKFFRLLLLFFVWNKRHMNPLDDAEASASGDFPQQMGELKALISDKMASECSRFEKLSSLISEGRDAVLEWVLRQKGSSVNSDEIMSYSEEESKVVYDFSQKIDENRRLKEKNGELEEKVKTITTVPGKTALLIFLLGKRVSGTKVFILIFLWFKLIFSIL